MEVPTKACISSPINAACPAAIVHAAFGNWSATSGMVTTASRLGKIKDTTRTREKRNAESPIITKATRAACALTFTSAWAAADSDPTREYVKKPLNKIRMIASEPRRHHSLKP